MQKLAERDVQTSPAAAGFFCTGFSVGFTETLHVVFVRRRTVFMMLSNRMLSAADYYCRGASSADQNNAQRNEHIAVVAG